VHMNNTLDINEYIFDNLIWSIISLYFYKKILFHGYSNLGYDKSFKFLILITISLVSFGMMISLIRNRNEFSVFSNITIPLGIYTIMTYIKINRTFISIVLICSISFSLVYLLFLIFKRIQDWEKVVKILIRRANKFLWVSQFIFSVGFAVVIAFYSFNIVFGRGVIAAGTTNNIEIETHNESIDSNADEILLLRENSWEELTVKQRVNVLQTVADIEKDYLGVNHNFYVLVDNTGKYLLGNYDNDTYNIKINTDTIMYGSAKECLKIICHEVYHGYSYCMISALDNSQEELKNLKIYEDAQIYKKEFGNYKSGIDEYDEYYYQQCEVDARSYAENSVNYYMSYIYNYMSE
jgi:hypothetical protein